MAKSDLDISLKELQSRFDCLLALLPDLGATLLLTHRIAHIYLL